MNIKKPKYWMFASEPAITTFSVWLFIGLCMSSYRKEGLKRTVLDFLPFTAHFFVIYDFWILAPAICG